MTTKGVSFHHDYTSDILLNISQLEKIEYESMKYTVFGYIRHIISLHLIPKVIIYIILAFYIQLLDEFNPKLCGSTIQISIDNKRIMGGTKWNTVYGKRIISSTFNGTYIWKIQSIGDNTYKTYIGIDDAKAMFVEKDYSNSKITENYAYDCYIGRLFYKYDGHIIDYLPRMIKEGDILTMKLQFGENLNHGLLSFKVNDGKEMIGSDKVKRIKSLNYRLAISLKGSFRLYEIIG